MIHRHPMRKWTIEVSDDPDFAGDRYEATWHETIRLDRPCELFRLVSDQNPDDAVVQLLLFEDGSLQSWTWQPAMVQVHPRQKHVIVGVLRAAASEPHRDAASDRS